MPSLGPETAGEEEEADRRRQEAEGRMMELARACGELGTPPSPQRRSSARLRRPEAPAATQTQYEFVKRTTKRKRPRSTAYENEADMELDRQRQEADGRMMELARACGKLGTPPSSQRRASARLQRPEATPYEFVKRSTKRKRPRGTAYESKADVKLKRRFNNTIRCSLKEFFECAELLKDRHVARVRKAGFGAMLDGKLRGGLISRPLIGFLMGKIDPATMTMKLGESKVIAITSGAIHHLFGLPQGGHTAPRPSESGYDKTVMKLKLELGFKRSDNVMTRDLRGLLKRLVEDEEKDELALKVFFLVVFMKVICPGASARVSREAAMLEDLDFDKMADMDFCQLLVDELQRAVVRYQSGKALWQAITGCAIAPLLIYLDCCNLRKVSELDTRTPRTHFMTVDNLKKIASADLIEKGGPDPQTWLYGKLPWKAHKDTVYYGLIVEPICSVPPIAVPDLRAAKRMPSLSSETTGKEEEVDRHRQEAEGRMMELARACGELGTPAYPQCRSSARLRRPERPAAMQYEFVKRSTKRKRAHSNAYENEAGMKLKRGFNQTIRCSLKEFFECADLLKDRHLARVRKAGFGAMLDGKVRGLISRPLIGFLMGKIDPATMKLKLGESKVVAITSDAIHHLFGLPQGGHTAPRPSESGYDEAVMKLKVELGFKRSDIIMTRDLRGLLKRLVDDEEKDDLALKVFFLVVFMKVICPGASARISREAAMLEDLDFDKMADMDFCQLLVDELQRAVVRYQSGKALWQAITGCAIAPLLIYLDCCNLRKVSELDTRTPRTHFMTVDNLKKIASADLIEKGGPDPQTWLYGKLPWKAHKDIVYYGLIVEPICLVTPIVRGAQIRHSSLKKTIGPQGAVADDAPAPAVAGSSNGVTPESEKSNDNVAATVLNQIDVLLPRACDLSRQVPTSSARLSQTEGILPPGHGFDAEAAKQGLSKEAALLYPGTEAFLDPRAAERMPSLGLETAGEEEKVDLRRPEAEETMVELVRACGELGTPPYPQRRSSARLRPPEAPAATQYEFVKRSTKRKRAHSTVYENEAAMKLNREYNKTVRCSLKEFFECAELLKDRHLARVRKAGFGAMLDGKVRGLISRPLIGFLMGKIDPATMTMKLEDAKVVAITSDAIHHLFGLPQGGHPAPRPSENGHDKAVMKLKQELGFKRSDNIMTRDLRGLLKRLVDDEEKDDLALKVFFLVVFMKVICPGASARISREAAMLEDLDFDKMADMDFCQLLVDELQRAVVRYQSGKALWQAITGCAIAPLLIYLDCCNLRKVSELDTRTPRTHFMTDDNLKKIASADLIQKGGPDTQTWLYGKLPWKAHKDIVYYELIVEPICSVPPIARSSRLPRSTPKNMDPQGAVTDDDPAPAVASSSNGAGPEPERSPENVAATALSQIDVLLARACDLSRQVPTTSSRLSRTEGVLPPGHGFDAEAAKEGLSREAALLDHLQKATFHLRSSFALFKSVQDDRCRPYEDEAKSFAKRMEEQEAAAAAAQGSERETEAPADEQFEENADHFMSCDDEEDAEEEEEEAASPVSTPPQDLTDDDDEDPDYAG